jgi:hypothetical protein
MIGHGWNVKYFGVIRYMNYAGLKRKFEYRILRTAMDITATLEV